MGRMVPPDAAGAAVTGTTYQRAAGMNLHPDAYLERNDSYTFFARLDDLLKPGPTGTNVNDLVFLFVLLNTYRGPSKKG